MPVYLKDLKIYNEFRNEPTDWLLANIGDKIRFEHTIDIKTTAISSTDNPFVYRNTDGYIGDGWVTGGNFADFKIGDTVYLYDRDTALNYLLIIVDKLSENEIRLGGTSGANNVIISNYNFSVANQITAIRYKWNLVENNDAPTFASKIDGTIQELVHRNKSASDVSVSAMEFLGAKPYQIGNATIQGVAIDLTTGVYISKYKIIHYSFVTPMMLAQQWNDLQNNVAPNYFFNTNALKAIFDFEAQYNFTDPNRIQTEDITTIVGNSGWFNENFNTGISNYFIDSVIFKRPTLEVIPAIELVTSETIVEIVVKNIIDTPFLNNNTKFSLNFIKAPYDETEYQSNTNAMAVNFCFDRALQTIGSPVINGENYGTPNQVLKDISAVYVSTSEIKITAKIAMVASVINVISTSQEPRYILWVAVQKHTLATSLSDKVAMLVKADNFYSDYSDPTMIVIVNKFLKHYESDTVTEGSASLSVFPEDEVVAYSQFHIDKNTRLTDAISLVGATASIKAKNSVSGAEFNLDTFNLNMTGFPFINGNQFVDFSLDRVFHIPSVEIRKKIKIKRRIDLDGADKYYYDVAFPFLVRWEYWAAIASANGVFFDTTQPKNGWNQFWNRYTTLANWGLYYELKITALKNGNLLNYKIENQFESSDYDTSSAWEPDSIKAYDVDTNALLFDAISGNSFILGYKNTRVVCLFENVSYTPLLANISVVFGIEVFEEGGVQGRRRMSSVWETETNTWFKSLDLSNKVIVTLTGNIIKGEVLIDFTQLPLNKQKFKITARLYDKELPSKEFQDLKVFGFQDVNIYNFQDQDQ